MTHLGGENSFVVIVDGHYFIVEQSPIYASGYRLNERWIILDVGSGARRAQPHAQRIKQILVHTLQLLGDNDYADMHPREFVHKVLEARIDADDGRQVHSGG